MQFDGNFLSKNEIPLKNLHYIGMEIKIDFEKEFMELKRAVALSHLKLGYPVQLIARIFKITEKATEFFINEEIKTL